MKKLLLLFIVVLLTCCQIIANSRNLGKVNDALPKENEVLITDNPTGFTATTISDTQIDLSWILNLASDSVLVVFNTTNTFGIPTDGISYNMGNIIAGGGEVIYKGIGTAFSHNFLTQNTNYYYKIFSFSSSWIYSTGVAANAKTLCTAIGPSITEGFENGGVIPNCWSQEYVSGSLNWVFTNGNPYAPNLPTAAFEGSYCAFLGTNTTTNSGNKTKLVMPPIDFTLGTGVANLAFWACVPSSDVLKVFYKTSYNGAWTLLTTADNNNGNWKHYVISLPNLSNDYYIAFEGTRSNILKKGICIDRLGAYRDPINGSGTGCSIPTVSSITGPYVLCMGGPGTWSVSAVAGNSYLWSYSDGNMAYSSFGSNSFTASASVGNGAFNICVTPLNSCEYGVTTCIYVCNDAGGPQSRPIYGNASPCIGSTQIYQAIPVIVSPYHCSWGVPPGWTIVSGQSTSSITVIVGATSGNIALMIGSGVCTGGCPILGTLFAVTPISIPAQPSIITGQTTPCQGTSKTYSVINVAGTTYNWTFPSGWTQIGGGTTNSVIVTVGSGIGNITVTPSNTCGTGTPRTLAVTPSLLPLQPGVISGNINSCIGSSETYSVPLTAGVTYTWSFPIGWVQTGGGTTNSVVVTVGSNSGNIVVTPSNACGNGPTRSLAVTTNSSASALINIAASPSIPICSGTSVTFTSVIINGGSTPTYQWLLNGNPVGTNSSAFSSNSLNNGDIVICVLASNSICAASLIDTSNIITMSVQPVLPVTVSMVESVNNICPGTTVNFTAIHTNGGGSPIYQWYLNGSSVGTNLNTYSNSSLNNGDIIYCKLTSNQTCIINNPDTSNSVVMQINPTYSFTENHSICNGENYIWHGQNLNTAGVFYDNHQSVYGCDSNYILNLTVNSIFSFIENTSICYGANYSWHGQNLNLAGTYYDNQQTIDGCDSVYTLNLSVNSIYTFNENHSICFGDNYNWHGQNLNTAGIYNDNHQTISGCDSNYTLNLAINPVYTFLENHSICNGGNYSWHGQNLNTAGTFNDNLLSVDGCDSSYTLNLVINPVYSFTENHSICEGENYNWHGQNLDSNGVFNDSLQTINGCDSTFILNLSVNNLPIAPIISIIGNTLLSDALIGNQWYDQNGIINGAINQYYIFTTDGDYYVIASINGCSSDTSNIIHIVTIGVSQNETGSLFELYPCPFVNDLIIVNKNNKEKLNFEILNSIGQVVYKGILQEKIIVPTANFATGVYLIKLENGKTFEFKKIVKE
jgi:hypothetical protein